MENKIVADEAWVVGVALQVHTRCVSKVSRRWGLVPGNLMKMNIPDARVILSSVRCLRADYDVVSHVSSDSKASNFHFSPTTLSNDNWLCGGHLPNNLRVLACGIDSAFGAIFASFCKGNRQPAHLPADEACFNTQRPPQCEAKSPRI